MLLMFNIIVHKYKFHMPNIVMLEPYNNSVVGRCVSRIRFFYLWAIFSSLHYRVVQYCIFNLHEFQQQSIYYEWMKIIWNNIRKMCDQYESQKLQYLERMPHPPYLVFMRVLYPGQIGIWSVGFCGGSKTIGVRRDPTTNSTHIWHHAGIEPRPHWWEASAVITAPSLLPESLMRINVLILIQIEIVKCTFNSSNNNNINNSHNF